MKPGKQPLKKFEKQERRKERLSNLGQPVTKEHEDKYADKAAETRGNDKECIGSPLLETTKYKPQEDKLGIYRSNITTFLDDIMGNISRRVYGSAWSHINYLRNSLLKDSLYNRLTQQERNKIEESVNALEELCLACQTPIISD